MFDRKCSLSFLLKGHARDAMEYLPVILLNYPVCEEADGVLKWLQ